MLQFLLNDKPIHVGTDFEIKSNAKNKSTIKLENCFFDDPRQIQFIPDYSYLKILDGPNVFFEGIVK